MVTKTNRPARTLASAAAGLVALAGLGFASTPSAQAATASTAVAPLNQTVTITTAGWGHGRGMSQYGAWGAAKQGLKYDAILAFYYPGTKTASTPNDTMRVWIKADDGTLNVKPAKGLGVQDAAGKSVALPTGSKYTQWRITRSSDKQKLAYRDTKGSWVTYTPKGLSTSKIWYFYNSSSGNVSVVLPGGTTRSYRGTVAHVLYDTSARTVNYVPLESYLRAVVPSEMPASWSSEALKAQSVAARSYAVRYKGNLKGAKDYDVCDTSACQVYKGIGNEYATTDAAVQATAGQVLTYQGTVAWTEFTSSNGGYSAAGSFPYQVAKADPYDAAMRQYWAVPVTASAIAAKYPTIGTFSSLTVNSRDGKGMWGGRVTSVTITGSKKSVTVSGTSFKSTMGLRETLMIVTAGLAKGTANYARWQSLGGSSGITLGPPSASETSVGGGLVAPFTGGTLYWTAATGSRMLSGPVLAAYAGADGPTGDLGFPTSDVRPITVTKAGSIAQGTEATFANGLISCPSTAKTADDCVVSYG